MAGIEKLKRARTVARSWMTRTVNKLIDVLKPENPDPLILEAAMAEVNKKLSDLDVAQSAYELEVGEAELDDVIQEAADVREKVQSVLIDATRVFREVADARSRSPSRHSNSASQSSGGLSPAVRLPKLDLPQFSGVVTEWPAFWDTFKVTVHDSQLPNVTKFSYLRSILSSEAKRTIEGLSLSDANYDIACSLLVEKYGRKERIIFAHIQALLSLRDKLLTGTSTPVLRHLYEEITMHVRSLESLGINGEQYGVVLTPVILSAIPNGIRMEWAREQGKESDLDWLLAFLKTEVERRERSEAYKTARPHELKEEKKKNPSASALHSQSVKGSKSDGGCGLCGKVHQTQKCYTLLRLKIVDRQMRIKNAGLCFRCLRSSHFAKNCNAFCSHCQGRHHLVCCHKYESENSKYSSQPPSPKDVSISVSPVPLDATSPKVEVQSRPILVANADKHLSETFFQVAEVKVSGRTDVLATLFFDSGSDHSYICSSLVRKLQPRFIASKRIGYAPFGGGSTRPMNRNVYEIFVRGQNYGNETVRFTAMEIQEICAPLRKASVELSMLGPLKNTEMSVDYCSSGSKPTNIDILIGMDHYWEFVGQKCLKLDCGLVAQDSVFGWLLSGSFSDSPSSAAHAVMAHQLLIVDNVSEELVRKCWELDSIGIVDKEITLSESDPCLMKFEKTIQYSDGRYTVGLPWKEDRPPLLDNESLARSRLARLMHKLGNDPLLHDRYDGVFREMEETGIIEEVPPDGDPPSHPVFYLPHRPVLRESSTTTKVRPVFDASAKGFNNTSLNDCLYPGPSLISNLSEILLRFRRWPFAVSADITKAFLQISLQPDDKDVHRFLWHVNGIVRKMRFCRVTFGVNSSPFLLNATIRHHLSQFSDSNVIKELRDNLYVDDWLSGCDSEEAALDMFNEAQSIMSKAGMKLAKWSSNSMTICDKAGLIVDDPGLTKVLGIIWLPREDCFTFSAIDIPSDLFITKRVVLSFIAKLFDPMGFIGPYIMMAKILFQELWVLGLDWDCEVPAEANKQFCSWLLGFEVLKQFRIPRPYFDLPWKYVSSNVHIHVFGDASQKAYGAVAYISVFSEGTWKSNFVISKSKVAPLKRVTLPRLELMACLLVARLLHFVRLALQLTNSVHYTCWTDSTVALSWIRGDPNKWKPFVSNRVRDIQSLTDPASWKHCSGKDNPADIISRGMAADSLIDCPLWFEGPMWLSNPIVCSEQQNILPRPEVCSNELVVMTSGSTSLSEAVFPFERWGSFSKLLRVVAWVLRFIHNLRASVDKSSGDLTYKELSEAKIVAFRDVQRQVFCSDINTLLKGETLPKGSALFKLTPFIDTEGLVRIRGRLQRSELAYSEKHPIILPKGHVSKLLVRFQHLLLKHAGVNLLLTSLRNEYWIIGLRRLIKAVKQQCLPCQIQEAKACNQTVAPLPELRVSQSPPFTIVGIDYAGPLFCADIPGKKLYICLFTCAVIRAVHLELTDSLSTRDFLLAFKRFSARRGLPMVIYTDNAKTFHGSKSLLLRQYGPSCPKWKFIIPRSPWWGGWWERLVQSVKKSLKRSLGKSCLPRIELETTLFEIENCINSRPLTFVSDDAQDLQPLTPNHFLTSKGLSFHGSIVEDVDRVTPDSLRERVRHEALQIFWDRWKDEYLKNLPHCVLKFKENVCVDVGSVVLIREDHVPRLRWDMGVIVDVFPGKDMKVRSVKVQTTKGTYVRPIHRLHKLEMLSVLPETVHTVPKHKSDDITIPVKTRAGRIVKPVNRLELLTMIDEPSSDFD